MENFAESVAASARCEIPEYLPGRVSARQACHAAAGVRAGAAVVQPGDGSPVSGVSHDGPVGPHLVRGHRAVEDVAAGQAKTFFQVRRCQYLPGDHRIAEIGREAVDGGEYRIGILMSGHRQFTSHKQGEPFANAAG